MTLPAKMGYGVLLARVRTKYPPYGDTDRPPTEDIVTDVFGPRGKISDGSVTITLDPVIDVYLVDVNGQQGGRLSGTVTVPANVGNTLLGLGIRSSLVPAAVTFVANVAAPSPPSPADPLTTIGNVGATLIRVNTAANLNIASPINVTMTNNYTRLANFPVPVGTSPGTILNGTTKAFYAPEAAALVAAGAGTYA